VEEVRAIDFYSTAVEKIPVGTILEPQIILGRKMHSNDFWD